MKKEHFHVIHFSGEKYSALTPQSGVQIRIAQLIPILAKSKPCLPGFLPRRRKVIEWLQSPQNKAFSSKAEK